MTETRSAEGIFDRALRNLREAWQDISNSARVAIARGGAVAPDLPDVDRDRVREQMRECLAARGGEVSARARAAELGRIYLSLNDAGRRRFLELLAGEFGVDHDAIAAAAEWLRTARDDADRRAAERTLRQAATPPRVRLLRQFNALPEGVKFLVDRRAELLKWSKDDRALSALEHDLKDLLAGWFDVGFLELNRITWDSPAALLEKLSAYEAVHAVRGWTDLKNRLDSDRRCFAFFHPRMPSEPLIFVEVALVRGLAGNIQALLDERAPVGDPRKADTAIFYSISNAQRGLAGISFGGFLIKRVVDQLTAEFPNLKAFATLSPVPGFRAWLDDRFARGEPGMLGAYERKALAAVTKTSASKGLLKNILASDAWAKTPELAEALKQPLMRLATQYLVEAKRDDGRALDPVAHFHLSNGARVERLNWLGDRSAKGLRQSFGMMVNYQYRLADIEDHHEAYIGDGEVVAAKEVGGLM
ncbi:MAG: malonyl-CoA decarboxylase [Rhodospirillales bacterium]|nr:malonyl-CoA decarboxylase [Rhodospirillales bacterium]